MRESGRDLTHPPTTEPFGDIRASEMAALRSREGSIGELVAAQNEVRPRWQGVRVGRHAILTVF